MNDETKRYFEEIARRYADKVQKQSAEVYKEIAHEIGSAYDAHTMLINAFSIAYANCLAIYCHRHVGGDLQNLADTIYTEFQFLVKDLLAKHSGKVSFAIRVTPEDEKKEGNDGRKEGQGHSE